MLLLLLVLQALSYTSVCSFNCYLIQYVTDSMLLLQLSQACRDDSYVQHNAAATAVAVAIIAVAAFVA